MLLRLIPTSLLLVLCPIEGVMTNIDEDFRAKLLALEGLEQLVMLHDDSSDWPREVYIDKVNDTTVEVRDEDNNEFVIVIETIFYLM